MTTAVDILRAALAPVTRTRWFRRFATTALPSLERVLGRLSRGRLQLTAVLVPSLVLRTTGAKSGLARETELMYVPEPDGRMLVTGSNFAGAAHPAWSANLIAHPDAEVVVHGRPIPVRAHLVDEDEREAVWAFIEQQWPGYRGYERASGRTLRIFRLDPRTGAGGGYS